MRKLLHVLLPFLFFVGIVPGYGQNANQKIQLELKPLPNRLLLYSNPLIKDNEDMVVEEKGNQQKLNNFEKDLMVRLADIYRTQVKAIEAQLNGDALKAEKHIRAAINALQALLDSYPEVQSNRRFSQLYGSVMTEYREFYGITEPLNKEEGEIFAVQEELYSGEDDWLEEGYVLPENITTEKTKVPLVQNRQVNRHLMYYSLKRPQVMETWLKRSKKYFPMMKEIFEEEGAPTELIHMAMVESGLNPRAKSWASAVGMWQFIESTGSMYGLEVNWWIDERRDPEKATRAAARHLKDLYNRWGDWHLAMANYNISPRGLNRAIRAAGKEDYWAALPYLPRETQGYVPGFIAATMIEMNPTEFGFKKDYENEAYEYAVYEVDPLMPLDDLARAAGITTEELKDYNPELLRWATPPGKKYPLKLPVDSREQFASNYEDIPKEERSQSVAMHTVRSGESLGYISQKYGTTVRALYETNEGLSSIIHPGQTIIVPLAPGSKAKIAVNRPTHQPRGKTNRTRSKAKAPSNSTKITYEVKRGDTIGHIAEWYDVRAHQIRAWNGTSDSIYPEQDLAVYVPDSKKAYYRQVEGMSFSKKQQIEREQRAGKDVTSIYLASSEGSGSSQYTVRSNDTLIDIANSFGTSVNQLKSLNNLDGSRIYVGQKLRVR